MICPHCRLEIGGVHFLCSRCKREVPEVDLRTASGDRTTVCPECRARKRDQVVARRRAAS